MEERRLRTYIHKGKVRVGCRRLPRKLKKKNKKRIDKEIADYFQWLKELHGNKWEDYIILGG